MNPFKWSNKISFPVLDQTYAPLDDMTAREALDIALGFLCVCTSNGCITKFPPGITVTTEFVESLPGTAERHFTKRAA